jgi:membrane protein DedA with SNARE-associated domain
MNERRSMKKLLKWFVYLTTAIYSLGAVINIANSQSDIYQIWIGLTLIVAVYMIENRVR